MNLAYRLAHSGGDNYTNLQQLTIPEFHALVLVHNALIKEQDERNKQARSR